MVSEVEQNYLKALYLVISKKGYARVSDIARIVERNVSTVTSAMQKLSEGGYVNYERYGAVTLTDSGTEIGKEIADRFATFRKLLSVLGIPDEIAEKDACSRAHGLDPSSMDRIAGLVAFFELSPKGRKALENYGSFLEQTELKKQAENE